MSQDFDYGFIDVHCHVLPQVDDGSQSEEMSANMLRMAYDENIRTMILTPHNKIHIHSVSVEGIRKRIPILERLADEMGLDMQFYPGNELMYDSSLPDRLYEGQVQSMADSRYVLVEFHPSDSFDYIHEGLRRIQYEGYEVILAHCERYNCLVREMDHSELLINMGIYLQVNAADVIPKLFNPVTKYVNRLMQQGMVSFIGTDAHRDAGERAPRMLECADYLMKKFDPGYVRAMLYDNAAMVIEDQEFGNYY
jgi:protein-tyrosine phosphatase